MELNKPIGDYTLVRELGKGQFGKVYIGRKNTGGNSQSNMFAIKEISKEKIKSNNLLARLFETEVSIMKKIDHPNIIKLYDMIEHSGCYYLVLNYCDSGDMQERISER